MVEWAKQANSMGAGEILLTSIDKEGTQKGFDIELMKSVTTNVNIPVVASGGMGSMKDFFDVINQSEVDAVAIAHMLHYNKLNLINIRNQALEKKIKVRSFEK